MAFEILPSYALSNQTRLLADLHNIMQLAPPRHMQTKRGFAMSVAITNCGKVGWVSDRKGYRYSPLEPVRQMPWPAMPDSFSMLATQAADLAGYKNFAPDACLINQYQVGAKMGLHQDKDEQDFSQPIVSVSLGLSASFLFGGLDRQDKTQKVLLNHGDVIVWGGQTRLNYHGILPIKSIPNMQNSLLTPDNLTENYRHFFQSFGECRINLTFRRAL